MRRDHIASVATHRSKHIHAVLCRDPRELEDKGPVFTSSRPLQSASQRPTGLLVLRPEPASNTLLQSSAHTRFGGGA